MTAFSFNPAAVEADNSFTQVPLDWYTVTITSVEDSATSKGHALIIGVSVAMGEFIGASARTWINYDNPSAKAVEIAQQDLKTICEATGIQQLTDTDQLIGKQLECKMGPQTDSSFNEIKGWRGGQAPQQGFGFSDMENPAAFANNNSQAPAPAQAGSPWPGAGAHA